MRRWCLEIFTKMIAAGGPHHTIAQPHRRHVICHNANNGNARKILSSLELLA